MPISYVVMSPSESSLERFLYIFNASLTELSNKFVFRMSLWLVVQSGV